MDEIEIFGPILESARNAALTLFNETGGDCTFEQLQGVIGPVAEGFETEYNRTSLQLVLLGQVSAFLFEWVTVLHLVKALDEEGAVDVTQDSSPSRGLDGLRPSGLIAPGSYRDELRDPSE